MGSILSQPKSSFNRRLTKKDVEKAADELPLADKLFRRKFAVYVPAAYLYNDADFAKGVIVTGDKERDTRSAHELELAYLPIAPDDKNPGPNILEFFETEIPCSFRYEAEVTKVYEILMQHFREMAQYINNEPLMNPTKRERIIADLTRFDALAAKLHPQAHSLLPKHLGMSSVESKLKMFLRPVLATKEVKEEEAAAPAVPEYSSFQVGISPSILKGTKRWQ